MDKGKTVSSAGKIVPAIALTAAILAASACGDDSSGTASATTQVASGSTAPIAAGATKYPLSIQNCGKSLTFAAAPKQAIAMDQVASEALFGIRAEKAMVGTANQSDAVWPAFADAYKSVKVLADGSYPSKEQLLAASPDLVVGNTQYFTYSGFPPGSNFTRDELTAKKINGYTLRCDDEETLTQDKLSARYLELGQIFDLNAQAQQFVATLKTGFDQLATKLKGATPTKTFYYSSGEGPLGTYGQAREGLTLAGGANLFADLPALVGGMPPTVSAEQIITRNPEAILIEDDGALDPSAPSVDAKIAFLRKTLPTVNAVKNNRFCTIGFFDLEGGLRTVAAVQKLAQCLHPELKI